MSKSSTDANSRTEYNDNKLSALFTSNVLAFILILFYGETTKNREKKVITIFLKIEENLHIQSD